MEVEEHALRQSSKARWLMGVSVGLLALSAVTAGFNPFFFRAVLGITSVVVVNESGRELRDIKVQMLTSQLAPVTRDFPSLASGARAAVRIRTSDLIVNSVGLTLNGTRLEYTDGANVTPGEVLRLTVKPDGTIAFYQGSE